MIESQAGTLIHVMMSLRPSGAAYTTSDDFIFHNRATVLGEGDYYCMFLNCVHILITNYKIVINQYKLNILLQWF